MRPGISLGVLLVNFIGVPLAIPFELFLGAITEGFYQKFIPGIPPSLEFILWESVGVTSLLFPDDFFP